MLEAFRDTQIWKRLIIGDNDCFLLCKRQLKQTSLTGFHVIIQILTVLWQMSFPTLTTHWHVASKCDLYPDRLSWRDNLILSVLLQFLMHSHHPYRDHRCRPLLSPWRSLYGCRHLVFKKKKKTKKNHSHDHIGGQHHTAIVQLSKFKDNHRQSCHRKYAHTLKSCPKATQKKFQTISLLCLGIKYLPG